MNNSVSYTIIGAGGHSRSMIDALLSNGERINAVVDLNYNGADEVIIGVPVVGGYEKLSSQFDPNHGFLVLAVGDNKKREILFKELTELGYRIPSLVHSSAVICSSTIIEEGSFVGAGCIVNALAVIASNTIINTGSIIEHESVIRSHVHIAPGVNMAGRVTVGERAFVGIGSRIIEKVFLGADVTVGAGSVVLGDVADGKTVAGVPAKEL